MLQDRSLVKIADNSGGQIGRVFKILGGSKRHYAELGDQVVISIQTAQPRKAVKKKEVHRAVVVRLPAPAKRNVRRLSRASATAFCNSSTLFSLISAI